jgi:hypothetical protein
MVGGGKRKARTGTNAARMKGSAERLKGRAMHHKLWKGVMLGGREWRKEQ